MFFFSTCIISEFNQIHCVLIDLLHWKKYFLDDCPMHNIGRFFIIRHIHNHTSIISSEG